MKKIYLVWIVICLSFLVILLIICSININRIKIERAELENVLLFHQDSLSRINSLIKYSDVTEELMINNCTVYDVNTRDSIKISSLLHKRTVIIRFMRTGCSSCIQQQIEALHYLSKFDNVITLVNSESMRELRIFLHKHNIMPAVYWLKPTEILYEGDDVSRFLISCVDENKKMLKQFYLDSESLYLLKLILLN
jgi:hypothetical protein